MLLTPKEMADEVIIPTLTPLKLNNKPSVVPLLLGTCAVESNFGKYNRQILGPALSVFQIEPFTFYDIKNRRNSYFMKAGYNTIKLKAEDMLDDLKLSCLVCRLKYLDTPKPLPNSPDDVEALARYWKQFYNTRLGKGSIEDFIEKYNRYILGEKK